MAVRCNHERGVTQATTKEMKKGNILTAAEKTKNAVWRQSTRSSARGQGPRASILVHPEQDLAALEGSLFLGRQAAFQKMDQ
jgi:hypothetical protein